MTSKREQILSAIATTLAGTAGVSTRIYRSRVDAMSRAETPALLIEPLTDRPTQNTSLPTLDWTLRVRISVVVRSSAPDTTADQTIESLHSKLMEDLTLGGYAIDVQPAQTTFNFFDADQPAGVIYCEYEVMYRTQVGDLTQ